MEKECYEEEVQPYQENGLLMRVYVSTPLCGSRIYTGLRTRQYRCEQTRTSEWQIIITYWKVGRSILQHID